MSLLTDKGDKFIPRSFCFSLSELTALHIIVLIERYDLLRMILPLLDLPSSKAPGTVNPNPNVNVNLDITDEYNNTILHYLALYNQVDLVKTLLERGVKRDAKNFEGDEPIHVCTFEDSIDCFKVFLDEFSKPDSMGKTDSFEDIILNRRNNKGSNCFNLTIQHKSLKIFVYCLGLIKKLDSLDENQKAPIHYIIDSKNMEFLDAFLEKKTNLKIVNQQKENPLFYCLKTGMTNFFRILVEKYEEEYIQNKTRDGQNLMHYAVEYNNAAAVKILLEYEVSFTDLDSKSRTPLEMAKEKPEILRLLTQRD